MLAPGNRLMKRLGDFSVARLVSLMVVLTLGPLGLLAYAAVTLAGDAVTNEVKARAHGLSDVSASLISDKLESLAQLVDSYADRPSLEEATQKGGRSSKSTIRDHLKDLLRREGVATAFLADPDGILIEILPRTPSIVGDDFSYRDWYRGVTETNRPYVSEVYRTAAKGNPLVVAAASPVRAPGYVGERGKILGILVAAYDISAIQSFTDQIAAHSDTHLIVTDQRGAVVASAGRVSTKLNSVRDRWEVAEALDGRSGVREIGEGDDARLSAYSPVPKIGFTVIGSVPSDEALAGVGNLRSTVLGIALGLALVLMTGLLLLVLALKGRRSIQEALEASEARTRAIIEAASDAYASVDAIGRIAGWNAQAERMFGWRASEVMGRKADEIVAPAFGATNGDGVLEFLDAAEGARQRVEFTASRRDGTTFPAELSSWSTGPDGSATFHAFVTDVTNRNRARDEMRAAQLAAEEANRSKSEFVSRMSHELRTPMNGILGFAQLLEIEGNLRQEQQESVREIVRAGKHLLDLINEVLDIAQIESGKLSVSLEAVSVEAVVRDCAALIRPLLDQRKLTLAIETGPAEAYALADHQRLKQLVLNLLSNATKYNRPFGHIAIRCSASSDERIELSVRDTGLGIPADKIERLFTPFDRLDVPDEKEEGTGLGLALSKNLVEVMNGSISVESELGNGTTFTISLPAAEPPVKGALAMPSAEESVGQEPSRNSSILYVEDNVANVTLVERILKRRPLVTLQTVMLGQLGIDLASELMPDIILLDMNLPDMNGDEVLLRLQADAVTKSIPVVMLSADATGGQVNRMLAAGAAGYLTKPLDVAEFLSTIDAVLMKGTKYAVDY